eukprot:Pgem_evm1s1498
MFSSLSTLMPMAIICLFYCSLTRAAVTDIKINHPSRQRLLMDVEMFENVFKKRVIPDSQVLLKENRINITSTFSAFHHYMHTGLVHNPLFLESELAKNKVVQYFVKNLPVDFPEYLLIPFLATDPTNEDPNAIGHFLTYVVYFDRTKKIFKVGAMDSDFSRHSNPIVIDLINSYINFWDFDFHNLPTNYAIQEIPVAQQRDEFSCGYRAIYNVFNLMGMISDYKQINGKFDVFEDVKDDRLLEQPSQAHLDFAYQLAD